MPHHTRSMLRGQAKTMRQTGESVWVLQSNKDATDRSTPLDAFAADMPEDPSLDTVTVIYAKVTWDMGAISYDEAGTALNVKATVESNIQDRPILAAAYAIRFSNGMTLRKVSERPSPAELGYVVQVAGDSNVVGT